MSNSKPDWKHCRECNKKALEIKHKIIILKKQMIKLQEELLLIEEKKEDCNKKRLGGQD
jgi:serine protease inhibitor ecotin